MTKYALTCGNTFHFIMDEDGVKRLIYTKNGKLCLEDISDYYKRIMTKPRAEFVRKVVIEESSKDAEKIGQLCSDEWGGDWGVVLGEPNLNRCFWVGTCLIGNAAKFFDEDIREFPWNLNLSI